ncbi:MAG: hypothetical protein E6H67_00860 [Betaproteobacteria bacterium]|nr:MAG: hypothetical protein E6H74_12590 [Betaproteobacteria bacterium]TMH08692.1 MAG: hypothetical protein E6H67_00860 [Betaproteobacteria bacterium]
MKRKRGWLPALAATFVVASTCAAASPAALQKVSSFQYLVGTWNCTHTVGTFSGAYTTTYANTLGNLWLKQTYEFPSAQNAGIEPAVRAEYLMGYDERRQAWVRFGAMSNGQYFAIRMTETGDGGWSWKYVSFFKTQTTESPGSDATLTKKSDSEYAVDGPSYEQNGTRVTEHHVCKKL